MSKSAKKILAERRAEDPKAADLRLARAYGIGALSPADTCRANNWRVGTRLSGDEGFGPTTIEITAIGEKKILAREIFPNLRDESSWTLEHRVWRPVFPLDTKPFILLRSNGYTREELPGNWEAPADSSAWKWEPRPNTEQSPERYSRRVQEGYAVVTAARQPERGIRLSCPDCDWSIRVAYEHQRLAFNTHQGEKHQKGPLRTQWDSVLDEKDPEAPWNA